MNAVYDIADYSRSGRIVVGRLRRGRVTMNADPQTGLTVQHSLSPETAKQVTTIRESVDSLRTGMIIIGIVGALIVIGIIIYVATRSANGQYSSSSS
jgi:hypothetical protein